MPRVTIYHNPRCTKSRQTLALLREQNVDLEVIEYLRNPPDVATLTRLIEQLQISPVELVRSKERQKLGLPQATGDEEVVRQIAEHPELMQRPIVVHAGRARLGRPPEKVLEIL